MPLNSVLFPCRISRGAFSGERVFEVNLQSGEMYTSVADRHYCMDNNKKILPKDSPAESQSIDGYIQAYLLPSQGDSAYISVPDGEVIPVSKDTLLRE